MPEGMPQVPAAGGGNKMIFIALGVLLGAVSARWQGSVVDTGATLFSVIGYAMPVFWLGQILMLIFALKLRWFPAQGMLSLRYDLTPLEVTLDVLHHLDGGPARRAARPIGHGHERRTQRHIRQGDGRLFPILHAPRLECTAFRENVRG